MTIDFEKDQQKIAENTDLNALSVHVEKIMDLDKQLEHQENVMKELKNQRDKISSETIPAILAEQGLQSLKLGLDMPSDFFHLYVKDETKMKR
jgi:hypothetical protein